MARGSTDPVRPSMFHVGIHMPAKNDTNCHMTEMLILIGESFVGFARATLRKFEDLPWRFGLGVIAACNSSKVRNSKDILLLMQ